MHASTIAMSRKTAAAAVGTCTHALTLVLISGGGTQSEGTDAVAEYIDFGCPAVGQTSSTLPIFQRHFHPEVHRGTARIILADEFQ